MKCLQRFSSLLLCLLCVSLGFSSVVSADELPSWVGPPNPDYEPPLMMSTGPTVVTTDYTLFNTFTIQELPIHTFNPIPLGEGSDTLVQTYSNNVYVSNIDTFYLSTVLRKTDQSVMFYADSNNTLYIEGYTPYFKFYWADLSMSTLNIPTDFTRVRLEYTDGTMEYFYNCVQRDYSSRDGTYTYKITFTPSKDVERVLIAESYKMADIADSTKYPTVTPAGYKSVIYYSNITIKTDTQSEEAGLLDGILGFIKSIKTKVDDTFTAIKDLPNTIWTKFENGLKNLFVPDVDYMASYSDKWSELLSSRFGAIYETVDYVAQIVDGIQNADETDTIEFPESCIDIGSGCEYSFGGWSVKIVPDGFSFLATSCKLIIGIISTLAFIQGLIKRYDEVFGG